MTERDNVRIEVALRDLGAHLDVPDPPDLTEAVRARLAEPRRATRNPFRGPTLLKVAAVVVIVLSAFAVLIAVSAPVRAGVLNLLRYAGIEFRSDQAPPTPAPTGSRVSTLPGERPVDLPAARDLAAFPVRVPAALGPPDEVRVSDGDPPRVVSLIYHAVRLDEFDGRTDLGVLGKSVGNEGVRWVRVNGNDAVWVPQPHEVYYIDRAGNRHNESARLAGKTLVWQVDGVTLRLEGDFTLDEVLAIAESVS